MTEPINAHLRSWENVRDIISLNATGVFMEGGKDYKGKNNMTELIYSLTGIVNYRRASSKEDTLNLAITSYNALPTLRIFLSNVGIKSFVELYTLRDNGKFPDELLNAINKYFQFYTDFLKEIVKDSRVLNKIIYDNYFNIQGQTDFLVDFPKKTQKPKVLNIDFSRAQENADSETKRIITVHQFVAYYDHSWFDSSEPPDEATCKFWIAIDSLLTEEQSNRLSYINNADINELTEAERNLRERLNSQDFRDMVINYQENTFQELTNYTEIVNGETIIKRLPDKNRFQRIMYLPDKDLTTEEKSLKDVFLQEAAKANNSEWIEKFINSLGEPKQIEMPKELQNAMSIIDSVDNAKINGIVEDNVLDSIYDDFTNKFFEFAEKNMSTKQLLSSLHSNKDFMLMFSHAKGSGFLKYCSSGEITEKDFKSENDFIQAISSKLEIYPDDKRQEILNKLLDKKSKLSPDIKDKLGIEFLELQDIMSGNVLLNEKTLPKFLSEIYLIFGNDYETAFATLKKFQDVAEFDPYVKNFLNKHITEILHVSISKSFNVKDDSNEMFNIMLKDLQKHPQQKLHHPLTSRNSNNKTDLKKSKETKLNTKDSI